jgi:hypothetical protein
MQLELGFDVPQQFRRAFGELVGAKVTFRLGVQNPNGQ